MPRKQIRDLFKTAEWMKIETLLTLNQLGTRVIKTLNINRVDYSKQYFSVWYFLVRIFFLCLACYSVFGSLIENYF